MAVEKKVHGYASTLGRARVGHAQSRLADARRANRIGLEAPVRRPRASRPRRVAPAIHGTAESARASNENAFSYRRERSGRVDSEGIDGGVRVVDPRIHEGVVDPAIHEGVIDLGLRSGARVVDR